MSTRGQSQRRSRFDHLAGPACTLCGSRFADHQCHARAPLPPRRPRPKGGGVPYAEILALHDQLASVSLRPIRDLAAVYGVPFPTAASWVRRARSQRDRSAQ